jgi:signal transduction histidine kinase
MLVPIFTLSISGGWFMAKRALAKVDEVTQIAREISAGSLDMRVPVRKTGDEIDQLAMTMNQMLERIQLLITNIKEMSDNIAHDLRIPITRIRGVAEVTLTTNSGIDDYRHLAASTIEECDILLSMINTMLIISQTEAGVRETDFLPIDFSLVTEKAVELFQSPAQDKSIRLTSDIREKTLINGEIKMIQRVIANLLDNAIKYSNSGGEIEISLDSNPQNQAVLIIADKGLGISEKDLPHIFERFYRGDPSRTQAGSGLGLSLVKAIVNSHSGIISVQSKVNQGTSFTIILPMVS